MAPAGAPVAEHTAAQSTSANGIRSHVVTASRMDERSRVLEILRANRSGRPISKCADSAGRVVACILRESGCSHHEKIGNVPALQIAVQCAVAGIVAHDGTAT